MLEEGEARMRASGISLWLVGLTPDVLTAVRRSPFGKAIGQERMFFNLEQAVVRYLDGVADDPLQNSRPTPM